MERVWPAERAAQAVVHCFTGTEEEATVFVKRGYMIGITGFVAKKNRAQDLRALLQKRCIPLSHLMIETDGPFMSPLGKIRRCEPAMLPYVAREIAELTGHTFEEVCEATTANAKKFFGLE